MNLKPAQWRYFSALLLVGDGVVAIIQPRRDALAWEIGPKSWQSLMDYLARHPRLTRVIGAAEVAAGLALIMTGRRTAHNISEIAAAVQNAAQDMA